MGDLEDIVPAIALLACLFHYEKLLYGYDSVLYVWSGGPTSGYRIDLDTLRNWVKHVMCKAGVESVFSVHSVRGAGTSKCVQNVCQLILF